MKKKPVTRMRLTERRKRESYVLYGVYAFCIVLLVGGIAYATRLPQVRIREVVVLGTQYAKAEEIQTVARDVLSGTYALLVPKDVRYLVPKGAVQERVLSAFPVLESVRVAESGKVLTVSVTERTPAASYCTDTCYRMDEYGFIFDVDRNDSLTTYRGGQLGIRDTFLAGSFHDLRATIRAIERATTMRVTDVIVDDTADVFARFETGGEVRFVLDTSHEKIATDLSSILTSSVFANGAQFEYIELRFGTKAAVKLKE